MVFAPVCCWNQANASPLVGGGFMNVMNEKVTHVMFGDGYVREQTDSTITVQFNDSFGNKKFLYPSAFEVFLLPKDPDVKQELDGEIQALRDKALAEERKAALEVKRQREAELAAAPARRRGGARKKAAVK
jgi:hypothetical protein